MAVRHLLRPVLNRFPRVKRLLKRLLGRTADVSTQYVEMRGAEADHEAARLRGAWTSDALPQKQRLLVDRQLALYRRGKPVDVFDVMVQAMRLVAPPQRTTSVLEVGCSSGFYSEVLSIAGFDVAYTGCDYSSAFVQLARATYPPLQFDVQDATALGYGDAAFDVVISGCCLLHIPEYEVAIAETARVARQFAIFHRTPVLLGQATKHFRKLAYGVETVEIHFNEPQFLALLRKYGLELLQTYTLDEQTTGTTGSASRTYVCRKASA